MKIEVYGDIAFLINFCMDYILLTVTFHALRTKSSRARRAAAAALGGIGAVCAFYVPSSLGVPMLACLAVLMCIISAPCASPRALFVRTAVFFAAAFVFGGGTLALLCASGADVLVKSGAFYVDMNVGVLAVSSAGCFVFCELLRLITKRAGMRLGRSVTVRFMDRKAEWRGYIDTGNTLTFDGTPVILTHWDAARTLFPESARLHDFMLCCPKERVYPVPYKAVGGCGVVWCIEPDEVLIDGKKYTALVGICAHSLSSDYDALLNNSLV